MINTIILDFAGVMTKEDFLPVLARECGRRLGLDPKRLKRDFIRNEAALELGKLSLEDFWEIAGKDYGIAFEDFANVFINSYDISQSVVNVMRQLSGRYRVVMLSDNFDVLSDAVRNDPAIVGIFERMLFSNETHMVKKTLACFQYALRELGARAEECVFVDDKRENILNALTTGMHAIRFRDAEKMKRNLEKHGVSFSYSSARQDI